MTEYLDRYPTMHEYAEGKRINPKLTDLISRADAMAEFREWVKRANENGETPTWNDAVSLIGSLPSADAEWIPCSEKLPTEGQGVLVTVDDNVYKIKVGSCIYSNGRFHSLYNDLTVTAWMPLPTPYKGGGDE